MRYTQRYEQNAAKCEMRLLMFRQSKMSNEKDLFTEWYVYSKALFLFSHEQAWNVKS